MNRRDLGRHALSAAAAAASATWALPSPAADSAPVRFVVPFAAGGGNDIFARLFAPGLAARLACPVVVENRSGASGNIGGDFVAHAPGDGKAALYASSAIAINPAVLPSVPFDAQRDLVPVSLAVSQPLVLVVRNELGINSLPRLLEQARAGKLSLAYGNASPGSISNLAAELLFRRAKVEALSVPYRGAGQMMTALLGGEVQVALLVYPVAKAHIDRGTLVAVATTGQKRMAQLPHIPTLVEQGFADLVADQWHGIFMPGKTPPALAEEFQRAFAATAHDPALRPRLEADGAEIIASTPQEFAAYFARDLARWKKIAAETGIRVAA